MLIWQASYTPFGEITITLDNLSASLAARFPGQYADAESGFYYNYFRDYDPELGRYIQSDPIGLDDGVNTYAYVGNNPLNYFDSDGLSRRSVRRQSSHQTLTNFHVRSLIQQIRRYDPSFRYQAVRPIGPAGRYNRSDIASLQQSLYNAQNAGFCGPGAANAPRFPTHPSQIQHIFRNESGHFNPLTPSSQARLSNLLRQVAANPANANNSVVSPGGQAAGVQGFTRDYNSGRVWVHTRNGIINNAGINRGK